MDKAPGEDLENRIREIIAGVMPEIRECIARQSKDQRNAPMQWVFPKAAIALLVCGCGVVIVGGIVLGIMLVQVIAWAKPALPEWVDYGLVGVPMILSGGIIAAIGMRKLEAFNSIPKEIAELFEDVSSSIGRVERVVGSVTDSVQTGVEMTKSALDIRHHVEARPWMMLAGAAVLGYIGGTLLREQQPEPAEAGGEAAGEAGSTRSRIHRLFGQLSHALKPEISRVEGVLIGALVSIIRETFAKTSQRPSKKQVEQAIRNFLASEQAQPDNGEAESSEAPEKNPAAL